MHGNFRFITCYLKNGRVGRADKPVAYLCRRQMITRQSCGVPTFIEGQAVWLQELPSDVRLPGYVIGQSKNGNYILQVIHENGRNEIAYETLFNVPPDAVQDAMGHKYPMTARSLTSVTRKIQAPDYVVWESHRAYMGVPLGLGKRAHADPQEITDDEAGGAEGQESRKVKSRCGSEIRESQLEVEFDQPGSPTLVNAAEPTGFGYVPVAKPASSFQKPVEEENTLPIEEPSQTGQC